MERIVASGLVIIRDHRLLVSNDGKDEFFKIPGGKVLRDESLEDCAMRELKEETGFEGKILGKLPTMKLGHKPQTDEPVDMFLYHFRGELEGKPLSLEPFEHSGHKVIWMDLKKPNDYEIAPNIKFLLDGGYLR